MKAKINVYVDTGNVYSYEVSNEASAREHADAILKNGYRSVSIENPCEITCWPTHRISKVKIILEIASTTSYTDSVKGT